MISKFYAPLLKKRAELENDERGFTLIELLVVVLIIGILAAIAIPVFLGQQDQARAGATKSDLANAKIAYVSYVADKDAVPASVDVLKTYGAEKSTNVTLTIKDGSTKTDFCISGANSDGGGTWNIKEDSGVASGAC